MGMFDDKPFPKAKEPKAKPVASGKVNREPKKGFTAKQRTGKVTTRNGK